MPDIFTRLVDARTSSSRYFFKVNLPFHLGHRPELDGIRGIAILIVLLHHATVPFISGGHVGVDIFFVLSGFLITTLLWQEHERSGIINIKNFYIRRALRLFPALLLVLGVFGVYALATKSGPNLIKAGKSIVYACLYLSDFARAFGYATLGELGHTWSLAIEEHFYLIWPPALWFMLKRRWPKLTILGFLVLMSIASAVDRGLRFDGTEAGYTRLYYGFDTRADGLLIGCILGLIASWGALPKVRSLPAAASAAILLGAIVYVPEDSATYAFGLLLINAAAAVFLAYVVTSRPAFLSNAFSVWVGGISYGLYLWHDFVFRVVGDHISKNPWFLLAFGGLVSFSLASLSYYLLEQPLLRLKQRFHAQPATPPTTQAVIDLTP